MSFSLQRMIAVLRKEFFQMMRDHVSVGMIIIIPLIQLILFGFNVSDNLNLSLSTLTFSISPFS